MAKHNHHRTLIVVGVAVLAIFLSLPQISNCFGENFLRSSVSSFKSFGNTVNKLTDKQHLDSVMNKITDNKSVGKVVNTLKDTKKIVNVVTENKSFGKVVHTLKDTKKIVNTITKNESLGKVVHTLKDTKQLGSVVMKGLTSSENSARSILMKQMLRSGHMTESVDLVLKKLHIDPYSGLEQVLTKKVLNRINLKKLGPCYSDKFGKQTLNIFKTSLKQIIHIFIKLHFGGRPFEMIRMVINLLKNLQELAKIIVECQKMKPGHKTKFGLTALSALSSIEFDQMLNKNLHKDEDDIADIKTKRINQVNEVTNLRNITSGYYRKPARLRRSTSKMFGFDRHTGTDNSQCNFKLKGKLPGSFDWRRYHAVTPVKHQGQCGSCYIFSTIASLESAILRKNGKSKSQAKSFALSEQEILNCITANKCVGGHPSDTLKYLKAYGAVLNKVSPYKQKPLACANNRGASRYKIRAFCYFRHNQLTDKLLQTLVYKYGPAIVSIDASQMKHVKGKYNGKCGTKNNHAVTLVGWTPDYWIIKNSWSKDWGVNGYLYLRRTNNKCGILKEAGVLIV